MASSCKFHNAYTRWALVTNDCMANELWPPSGRPGNTAYTVVDRFICQASVNNLGSLLQSIAMKKLLFAVYLGGLMLCLGCTGGNTVEMPSNPTPKPKDPFFQEQGAGGGQAAPAQLTPQKKPRA